MSDIDSSEQFEAYINAIDATFIPKLNKILSEIHMLEQRRTKLILDSPIYSKIHNFFQDGKNYRDGIKISHKECMEQFLLMLEKELEDIKQQCIREGICI